MYVQYIIMDRRLLVQLEISTTYVTRHGKVRESPRSPAPDFVDQKEELNVPASDSHPFSSASHSDVERKLGSGRSRIYRTEPSLESRG